MVNRVKYEPVTTDDEDIQKSNHHDSRPSKTRYLAPFIIAILTIVVAALTGISGFLWGRHFQKRLTTSEWFEFPGGEDITFQYEKIFAVSGEESQAQWDALFPIGLGFVQHPMISPNESCLAVYHQLHCLDTIRRGYWAAAQRPSPDQTVAPRHIRHCIDYLRQSLMCHADTNLEAIDADLGGTRGHGSSRKCRNFSQVTEWAVTWRTNNETVADIADLMN
ncbi:hypothetical protein F4821DRAFT_3110 [Hypoxylon rubiginosum]|uniref:Uncharacterized protein n=1 Tax=Hypoxylon rubiginosum TaxID=110542 RepID=A0ACC0DLB1_9PEZI|nr:hypothetical protein F4821DRAFT_3110 [Hypoxylon rubiginosum]